MGWLVTSIINFLLRIINLAVILKTSTATLILESTCLPFNTILLKSEVTSLYPSFSCHWRLHLLIWNAETSIPVWELTVRCTIVKLNISQTAPLIVRVCTHLVMYMYFKKFIAFTAPLKEPEVTTCMHSFKIYKIITKLPHMRATIQ